MTSKGPRVRSRPLVGKVALVTGGGRGIGEAVARSLAARGATVAVTGRTETEIAKVAGDIEGLAIRADLASPEGTAGLIEAVEDHLGKVDILVLNAGIAESRKLEETTDELWARTMEINVTAPFRLCRALVPKMVEAGWGRVIHMASNAGLMGYRYTSAYCASKHAMVGLMRAMAAELGKSGVTVNAVCPGWVRTKMSAAAVKNIAEKTGMGEAKAERALAKMSPQERLIEVEEVAHLVLSLCAEEARGIHGQALVIDGGALMR